MTHHDTSGIGTADAHKGEDFVCNVCGCEVMVKHWGEPRTHAEMGVFVCHCGASMGPEHPDGQRDATAGEGGFDEGDYLNQGSGVGGPGGFTTQPNSMSEGI